MKRVELTVTPKGEVRLETFGFKGKSCMDVDKILKSLSDNITNTKKGEYYANDQNEEVNIVQG
jgi:hypothetical protein